MEPNDHIVRYDLWCKKCIHFPADEQEDPCDECLSCPLNVNSRKPVRFEEKKD